MVRFVSGSFHAARHDRVFEPITMPRSSRRETGTKEQMMKSLLNYTQPGTHVGETLCWGSPTGDTADSTTTSHYQRIEDVLRSETCFGRFVIVLDGEVFMPPTAGRRGAIVWSVFERSDNAQEYIKRTPALAQVVEGLIQIVLIDDAFLKRYEKYFQSHFSE